MQFHFTTFFFFFNWQNIDNFYSYACSRFKQEAWRKLWNKWFLLVYIMFYYPVFLSILILLMKSWWYQWLINVMSNCIIAVTSWISQSYFDFSFFLLQNCCWRYWNCIQQIIKGMQWRGNNYSCIKFLWKSGIHH